VATQFPQLNTAPITDNDILMANTLLSFDQPTFKLQNSKQVTHNNKLGKQIPTDLQTNTKITFFILVHTLPEKVIRLIKAVYSPKHYYYLHIDAKAHETQQVLSSFSSQFPNVFVATTRFDTNWGGISLLYLNEGEVS
jgi:Core-2/I-Branching enzyme